MRIVEAMRWLSCANSRCLEVQPRVGGNVVRAHDRPAAWATMQRDLGQRLRYGLLNVAAPSCKPTGVLQERCQVGVLLAFHPTMLGSRVLVGPRGTERAVRPVSMHVLDAAGAREVRSDANVELAGVWRWCCKRVDRAASGCEQPRDQGARRLAPSRVVPKVCAFASAAIGCWNAERVVRHRRNDVAPYVACCVPLETRGADTENEHGGAMRSAKRWPQALASVLVAERRPGTAGSRHLPRPRRP